MVDGFLGRWSQRKTAARQQVVTEQEAGATATPSPGATNDRQPLAPSQPVAIASPNAASPATQPEPAVALPTLQDVADLTTESDFSPFVSRAVAPRVRNAAMKKLFADPHFNVMDGLDTYIDDYSVPDPLPVAMLRKMASARFMQLVDDPHDGHEQGAAEAAQPVASATDVAAATPVATDTETAAAQGATDTDDAESISAVPPDADREPPCA